MRRYNHTALIYNRTGQIVSFYPPDAEVIGEGAPTAAATYSVWGGTQSNDDAAKFTGAASLDAVNTTVDVASGYSEANRARIYVAATTDMVAGERYIVAGANREIVQARAISAGDHVTLANDLSYDYPITSSTVKGLRHYFTVDATFIALVSSINVWGADTVSATLGGVVTGSGGTQAPPYRVRWVYTTGSTVRESWTTFDVVRKPSKANLSYIDLLSVVPDVAYLEPLTQVGMHWAPQLVRAEMDVGLDLRAAGVEPDQVTDPDFYDRLCLWRWVVNIGQSLWLSNNEKPDWYDAFHTDYTQLRERYVGAGNKAWRATGSTGAINVAPPGNLWLR